MTGCQERKIVNKTESCILWVHKRDLTEKLFWGIVLRKDNAQIFQLN